MFSDNQRFLYRKIYKVSLRKFAQLSSADAVYLANRRTTYNRGKYRPLPLLTSHSSLCCRIFELWARIFKRVGDPGIDSKEWIPSA